ncbi:UNVERIFIED_CONTAM: hypothetical protein FKN15_003325 [Acipenser sinensis]
MSLISLLLAHTATVSLALVLTAFIFLYFYSKSSKSSNYNFPPGPPALPVIGNLNILDLHRPYKTLSKSKSTGYEVVKEALVTQADDFSERGQTHITEKFSKGGNGIVFGKGESWKVMRRFTLSTLRDFGMGKRTIEDRIIEESQRLVEVFQSHKGKPFDPQIINSAVSNIICSIVFGDRFNYGDAVPESAKNAEREHQADCEPQDTDATGKTLLVFQLYNMFPFLGCFLSDHKKVQTNRIMFEGYVINTYKDRKDSVDSNDLKSFIDTFISRQREELYNMFPFLGCFLSDHKKVQTNRIMFEGYVINTYKDRKDSVDSNDLKSFIDTFISRQREEVSPPVHPEYLFEVHSSWGHSATAPAASRSLGMLYSLHEAEELGMADIPPVDAAIASLGQAPKIALLNKDAACPNKQCRVSEIIFKRLTQLEFLLHRWCVCKSSLLTDKVQEEIESVIGRERPPQAEDRKRMPYMDAVLHEIQRVGNVVPMNLLHETTGDTTFRGYKIPKGTPVIPLLSSVLSDKTQWETPHQFNHFPDAQGKFVKRDAFMPFSAGQCVREEQGPGRRVCLGETLAKMELFLFFTMLLQKFHFRLPQEVSPEQLDLTPTPGITSGPQPFQLCTLSH